MSCPKCGEELELDPDGGWCDECHEYWDLGNLKEHQEEEDETDNCEGFDPISEKCMLCENSKGCGEVWTIEMEEQSQSRIKSEDEVKS